MGKRNRSHEQWVQPDVLWLFLCHVETTIGPAADGATTPKIPAALERRRLLPGTHIVGTGFLNADLCFDLCSFFRGARL